MQDDHLAASSQDPPLLTLAPIPLLRTSQTVTALCVSASLCVLGFESGNVVAIDASTAETLIEIRTFAPVCDIDCDSDFIVAATYTGQVFICSAPTPSIAHPTHPAPAKLAFADTNLRVALLPDHSVVVGGMSGRVVLTRTGFLSALRSRELFAGAGRGAVGDMACHPTREECVAWTDDAGLVVFAQAQVQHLALPMLEQPPTLVSWYDPDSIVVCAASRVCLVDASALRVLYMFDNGAPVLNLVPFGGRDGRLALVHGAHVDLVDSRLLAPAPGSAGGQARVSATALPQPALLAGHNARWAWTGGGKSSHMETGLPLVYICLQGGDLVTVRPRSLEDCLQFALGRQDFARALQICKGATRLGSGPGLSLTPAQVGEMWLASLLSAAQYEPAAALLPTLLRPDDTEAWSRWAAVLLERGALGFAVRDLPPQGLPHVVYESAVAQLLQQREGQFDLVLESVKKWAPHTSYDPERVLELLRPHQAKHAGARRAAGVVLAACGRSREAFVLFVRARAREALDLLDKDVTLWAAVVDPAALPSASLGAGGPQLSAGELQLLGEICGADEARAIGSLCEYCQLEDGGDVPARVRRAADWLQANGLEAGALRLLRKTSSQRRTEYVRGSGFEALSDLEVELTCKLEPMRLLELLRDSKAYSYDKALRACRQREGLLKETVYVLGRMGGPERSREALDILVHQLNDLRAALEFASARDGDWETLIELCLDDAGRLGELLELGPRFGMDAARLVRAVPLGVRVPQLKARVEAMFVDVRAQTLACETCSRIFRGDASGVVRNGHRMLRRGLKVHAGRGACVLCATDLGEGGDLVLFRDGGVYHRACLDELAQGVVAGQAAEAQAQPGQRGGEGGVVRAHVGIWMGAHAAG
jgi:hypothetical protein